MMQRAINLLAFGVALLFLPFSGVMAQGPTPTPPITPIPPTPGTAEAIPLPPELLAVLVFVLAMTGIWFILRKKSTT